MSIADKLTYLNTTKQLLKTEINKVNNVLTDNSTFRSYPQELFNGYLDILNNGTDTLWSNLEKVSASGEEATLENVETAPIKMVLNGNTSQETTSGKSLIDDYDLINRYKVASVSGNIITSNAISRNYDTFQPMTRSQKISLIENSDYYVSFDCRLKSGTYGGRIGRATIINTSGQALTINDTPILNPKMSSNFQRMCFKSTANTSTSERIAIMLQVQENLNSAVFEIKNIMISTSSDDTYEPYTGGQPSPNPDYPQEVKVVKGENVVSVSGKNLFDVSKLENASWNYPNEPTRLVMFLDKANQGTKMSATNLDTTTYRFSIGFAKLGYASRTNTIVNESGWTTNSTYTITANNDGYPFLQISRLDNANVSASEVEDKFQFEYSDTASEYTPFSKTDYPINLVSKNLFNVSAITENLFLEPNGNVGSSGVTNISNYISVKANQTYAISFDYKTLLNTNQRAVCYYDLDKNWLSGQYIDLPDKVISITPTENGYIRFSYDKNCYDIQLEKGTASSYEPYFTPIELCKINTYKDYFHKDSGKWYVHKEIGKKIFDGTEFWRAVPTNTTDVYRMLTTSLKGSILAPATRSTQFLAFCSRFKPIIADDTYKKNEGISCARDENVHIYMEDYNTSTSATDFKTWLSTHNVTLYYVLATPTEEEITDETLIEQLEAISKAKSVKEKTYVTQTNDELPFILDVEAIKEYNVE